MVKPNIDVILISNAKSDSYKDLTKFAINSCLENTSNVNIYVVEQNKDVEYDEPVKTINYEFDFNYNKCINYAVKNYCKSEFICFANNDVYFHEQWADYLLNNVPKKYLSASPYCHASHGKGKMHYTETANDISNYNVGKCIAGWCIFVHRSVFEIIGQLDEGVLFWYSDNLYKDQIKYHGIKHVLVYDSKVTHLGAGSNTLKSSANHDLYTSGQYKNYLKAAKKYVRNQEL